MGRGGRPCGRCGAPHGRHRPPPGAAPRSAPGRHRRRRDSSPGLWAGASGDLYHALLPSIIAQRITSGEAIRQWSRLCRELGEPPPGPELGLLLPPHPDRLAGRPAWWFHPLGIEAKRARALTEVARVARRLWDWARLPTADVAAKLRLIRGVGPWTVGSVLGPACADDDAVAIGDYHLPSIVSVEPRRRATRNRRPHAHPARTIPPPARPCHPTARPGRTNTTQVRPSPPRPPASIAGEPILCVTPGHAGR